MEECKYSSFAMETTSKYKYQIAMETAEQNTGKQFSAKETALQNVYKDSFTKIFFLIFNGVNAEKQSQGSGMKAF